MPKSIRRPEDEFLGKVTLEWEPRSLGWLECQGEDSLIIKKKKKRKRRQILLRKARPQESTKNQEKLRDRDFAGVQWLGLQAPRQGAQV